MKSITRQKSPEDIQQGLSGLDRVFIVGCGTCTTMTHTGGIDEVVAMKERLQEQGKRVTGFTVIPTACDDMTELAMKENGPAISSADCILSMSCALGVHRMNLYIGKPIIPAVDTLFIGIEDSPGYFREACAQCGQCLLGETAGVCPITACHKGLVNGPCGGTNNGRCEVDKEKDCAWTLIYNRLKEQDRLDLMRKYQPPRNHHVTLAPRSLRIQ
ncbi:MAG TPA: methylenetetrahydrofolate reductase C-terminal domain-containing protein [Dehalococcoidales bacterium]|nr:methylenetetrahydrofolate reductase C-terminal domain-containing protein [Dehalococcoidales bacterium]